MDFGTANRIIRDQFDAIARRSDRPNAVRIEDIQAHLKLNPSNIEDQLILENIDVIPSLVDLGDGYYELFDEDMFPARDPTERDVPEDHIPQTDLGQLPGDILRVTLPALPITVPTAVHDGALHMQREDCRTCYQCYRYDRSREYCKWRGIYRNASTPACGHIPARKQYRPRVSTITNS